MLHRYGEFITRHARLMLVVSGVALVAMAVVGVGAFGKLRTGGFDDPASQSSRAAAVVDLSCATVSAAFSQVKVRDVLLWIDSQLGVSVQAQRQRALPSL